MKTPTFYTRLPFTTYLIWGIIWVALSLISFGLLYNTIYSISFERKYFLNRLILLKWIKSKDFVLPLQSNTDYLNKWGIREYNFDGLCLWVYDRSLCITLSSKQHHDLIGLFECGYLDTLLTTHIIRAINNKVHI